MKKNFLSILILTSIFVTDLQIPVFGAGDIQTENSQDIIIDNKIDGDDSILSQEQIQIEDDSKENEVQQENEQQILEEADVSNEIEMNNAESENSSEMSEQNLLKENSWRYENGVRIISSEASFLSYTAWSKVNGYFVNNRGDIIPNAVAKGIDVSEHQGKIDWNAVKNSDVEYVIIRCGYGDDYTYQDDKRWFENVQACERLGIPYGVYIYSYAQTANQAASEARHVLRLISGRNLSYPVYYDMEDNSTLGSKEQFAEFAQIFCSTIEAAGYEAGVYANLNWWNTYLTDSRFEQWDRWVAQYNYQCDYKGNYNIWQCTSSGTVPGISGTVDLNFTMGENAYWKEENGNKYYYINGTKVINQGLKIGLNWYYFGNDGAMYCSEWREKEGKKYYYDESGHLVSNIGLKIEGYWYYFGSSGAMYCSEWREKEGKKYYYDENGHLMSNIGLKIEGYWYYFGSSGAMYCSEWREKEGEKYYYDENGHLMSNIGLKIEGYWYYFGSSGAMYCSEWREKEGEKYYYDENGHLVVDKVIWIEGELCIFDSSGKLI